MEIGLKKTITVQAKTLSISLKVRDCFMGSILDQDGEMIGNEYDGYVPEFMPGDHYGDYVNLDIDIETGQITNWEKPTREQIEEFINTNTTED